MKNNTQIKNERLRSGGEGRTNGVPFGTTGGTREEGRTKCTDTEPGLGWEYKKW